MDSIAENMKPAQKAKKSFRDTASFGGRIEYWVVGEMLRQGLDVYRPLVDDMGIDAIIRKKDGSFLEVQIKARSDDTKPEFAAGFAGIKCEQSGNYWFVFYSSQMGEKGTMWLMTAEEFRKHAKQTKSGKSAGTWTLYLGRCKKNKTTGREEPYALPEFEKYICRDFSFSRLIENGISDSSRE